MAFEVTEHNSAALDPLFKLWEEPIRHRVPNPAAGQPALVHPGRRPSRVPLVRAIRAEVDGWRRGGYAGVSDTETVTVVHQPFANCTKTSSHRKGSTSRCSRSAMYSNNVKLAT